MRSGVVYHAVRCVCVGLLLAGGASVTASAATTFSFGDGVDDQPSLQFLEDGLGLTVSGFDEDYDRASGTGPAAGVNQRGNGLGVSGSPESGRIAGGEALRFSFTQTVTLTSLVIHEAGQEVERFQVFDSNDILVASETVDGESLSAFHTLSLSGLSLFGQTFSIVGTSPNRGGTPNPNRGIRVSSVSVDRLTGVSAVPLPAPILLSLAGLAVFGAAGLRRRRPS